MAASGRLQAKTILIVALALFSCVANGELSHRIGVSNRRNLAAKAPAADTTAPPAASTSDSGATVFDVTKHGAKADGKFDNAQV